MADCPSSERIPVIIVCGSKKYDVAVQSSKPNGLPIVEDLQRAAEAVSGIPVVRQKVIFKGKTLRNPGSMLFEVGIEPHSRVMIVGQRVDPEQDEACRKIQKVVETCQDVERRLAALQSEMEGVKGGHLPAELHGQSLTKQVRTGAGLAEQLVKLLEQLDALTLDQDQSEARTRRKAAVQFIQATLDRVDGIQQQLADLKSKVS